MTFGRANEREKSNWAGEHFSFVSPFLTVMRGGGKTRCPKMFQITFNESTRQRETYSWGRPSLRDKESDSSHLIGADLCSPPAKTLFHLLFN